MGAVRQHTPSTVATVWSSSQILVAASETASTWSGPIVEKQDGRWIICDPETGIFGSGPNEPSALSDFEQALRDHLDVLSRQEALSPELQAQLTYLRWRLSP
jgi:hypothetical protein